LYKVASKIAAQSSVASSRSGFLAMSDQSIKSLALVGQFLHQWSQMEQAMHLAISAATKLDPLMSTIVCANLTIREKLNILRTLVDTSNIAPDERKTSLKALLRDIGEYTPVRNMMAHDFFMVGNNAPSIAFMPIKAKGKFDTPAVLWQESDFVREYAKINAFTEKLMQLTVSLEHASFSADAPIHRRDRGAGPSPVYPLERAIATLPERPGAATQ
jgi:hypothetical protein